jgi:hypothetical protein
MSRGQGCSSVVEHLPGIHEAPGVIPRLHCNNNKEKYERPLERKRKGLDIFVAVIHYA